MAKVSKKSKNKKKKATGNGSKGSQPKPPSQVDFHYIKGPDFRTIHVDGAIGGITTRNILHIAMFSERPAIPTVITQKIEPNGTLGAEIKRTGKSGVVRQMEVDLFLTQDTAKILKVWLDGKLEEFENLRQSAKLVAKK